MRPDPPFFQQPSVRNGFAGDALFVRVKPSIAALSSLVAPPLGVRQLDLKYPSILPAANSALNKQQLIFGILGTYCSV